eukprot:CAMPEP_0175934788 /NCGR_PEP_ID=MMETSP0108-20121206/20681_1 /TAXON_ID=195067 ORGANISM="Goniomonas pacifica, Strain CCMP1869" /NCGR_SAMPLE_ID=MMETSP0108 /ASSEMBLY_ACC=CAM_ASM_000204 /LENGTH=34 /DNA_ID= /DNA_START= /DNA_END= /DNA_ORIENTATION=
MTLIHREMGYPAAVRVVIPPAQGVCKTPEVGGKY